VIATGTVGRVPPAEVVVDTARAVVETGGVVEVAAVVVEVLGVVAGEVLVVAAVLPPHPATIRIPLSKEISMATENLVFIKIAPFIIKQLL
jgi:hypothetical protein